MIDSLPYLLPWLAPYQLLLLIKPQFELSPRPWARAAWSRTRPTTPAWRPVPAWPAPALGLQVHDYFGQPHHWR